MSKFYPLSILLLINIYILNAQNPLINDPSLNYDGSKIAFNYQGDIWTANANGTNIKRLTVHEAYDTHPLWSADGKSIAFHSNRYGNNDIFVVPVEGGLSKRLTYASSDDKLTDFTENEEILFNTKRDFNQIEWEPEIQTVNVKGGTPYLKLKAFGYDATLSPDKNSITFVKGPCRIQREEYKGPANKDIWLYNIERDKYQQLTTFKGNDFYPKWADDQTIYYQSAKSGKYNVYRMKISDNGVKTGGEEQVTDFKDMGIFSFNISKT